MKTTIIALLLSILLLCLVAAEVQEVADSETTTPNGCKCQSTCGTTKDDDFSTDRCFTDNCGQYGLAGYWDYCLYLNSQRPNYNILTWQEKQDQLWDSITADSTPGGFHIKLLFTQSPKTSFDNEWDVMPNGRKKTVHSVAAVCKFKIDIDKTSRYTGLLKANSTTHGLIRMGPTNVYSSGPGAFLTPGNAVKILRTGVNSANFMMMKKLGPLPNNTFNFFAETLSNHLPAEFPTAGLKKVRNKFCQTGLCLTKVGISHLTTHDQDGNKVKKPRFPYKLSFQTANVTFSEENPGSLEKFMEQFTNIPKGTVLYKVMAHSQPSDQEGSLLGHLVTESNCVTSNFGDNKLFFRHHPIEEDVAMKPEWEADYMSECGLEFC